VLGASNLGMGSMAGCFRLWEATVGWRAPQRDHGQPEREAGATGYAESQRGPQETDY
jgi:hypothetical protein